MTEEYIFYGAGHYAKEVMKSMLNLGIVPVCFADRDISKHYTEFQVSFSEGQERGVKVLPIDEALKIHPTAKVFITVEPESFQSVYNYLVEKGVPVARIKGPPLHCILIGNYITITDDDLFTCAQKRAPIRLSRSGDIRKDLEAYSTLCTALANDLKEGKPTACSGCQRLHAGSAKEDIDIKYLNLALTSICNFKCCYCIYCPDSDLSYEVLEILQHFIEEKDIEYVHLTSGEITIQEYKEQIIEILRKNKLNGLLYTNASVFMGEIQGLLRDTAFMLNISLDAGTKETYARVKKVDCFETVLHNIAQYASVADAHQICLKYIVLEGINIDNSNIDSFIDIAAKFRASVSISHDMFETFTPESDSVYSAISRIVRHCIDKEIPYRFSFLDKYYKRLDRDGLLNPKLQFFSEKDISDKLSS